MVTLEEALNTYIARKTLRPKTVQGYRSFIDRCVPEWKALPLDQITRAMCIDKHQALSNTVSPYATSGGAGQADSVFRIIRMVFNFAIIYFELNIKNPVEAFAVLDTWANLPQREDWIPPEAMRDWFRHVNALPAVDRDYYLTLAMTAQRPGEIAGLMWHEVDLENGLIDIPGKRTKDKKRHLFPMSTHLWELLRQRKVITGNTTYVFATFGKDDEYPAAKRAYEIVAEAINLDWSPHSCRRTWSTYAEEFCGIPRAMVKRCLFHSNKDITARYVIAQAETLRPAFQRVSDYIHFLATGEKPRIRLENTQGKRA